MARTTWAHLCADPLIRHAPRSPGRCRYRRWEFQAHHLGLPRRHVQIIQGLLRHTVKDRACGLTAPSGALWLINHDHYRQLWGFRWHIADKGSEDLAVAVATALGFLRCPGLARHGISLNRRRFAGTPLDHADQNIVDPLDGLR